MADSGRKILVKKNDVAILGCQSVSININGTAVDITNCDTNGFRLILNEAGVKSLDLSVTGVAEENIFRDLALGGPTANMLTDLTIEWPDGLVLDCNFFMDSYSNSGANDGYVDFNMNFLSSDEWNTTP
jgi:predicted secreted protein